MTLSIDVLSANVLSSVSRLLYSLTQACPRNVMYHTCCNILVASSDAF